MKTKILLGRKMKLKEIQKLTTTKIQSQNENKMQLVGNWIRIILQTKINKKCKKLKRELKTKD